MGNNDNSLQIPNFNRAIFRLLKLPNLHKDAAVKSLIISSAGAVNVPEKKSVTKKCVMRPLILVRIKNANIGI